MYTNLNNPNYVEFANVFICETIVGFVCVILLPTDRANAPDECGEYSPYYRLS